MANHDSAKKRIRRNNAKALVNKSRMSRMRSFIKKVELAITEGNAKEAKEALRNMQPALQRNVAKNLLHKNTAARKMSRLSARIKALG